MTTNKSVSDILVVTTNTSSNFQEEYAEALRFAVGLVRDGVAKLELQQVGTLHSFEEILAASDELADDFTDEELIEEVHYASKARGQ
jgi:hypothetical protein